jgi:hypothetical protein
LSLFIVVIYYSSLPLHFFPFSLLRSYFFSSLYNPLSARSSFSYHNHYHRRLHQYILLFLLLFFLFLNSCHFLFSFVFALFFYVSTTFPTLTTIVAHPGWGFKVTPPDLLLIFDEPRTFVPDNTILNQMVGKEIQHVQGMLSLHVELLRRPASGEREG